MKFKILFVHPVIFLDVCKFGANVRIVQDGIPEDTKFIRAFVDNSVALPRIGLVIESESFENLGDGDEIPVIIGPVFEKI